MKNYTWGENGTLINPFSVIHTENGVRTVIAQTDSAEKAHFITVACNQFDLEKYESEAKDQDSIRF